MREYALNQAIFRGEIGSPWIIQVVRNWFARRSVSTLDRFDDHILRDIGVSRADIRWAVGLPLSVNAALALEERSQRLRGERIGF